jgi:hypothetical protein
MIMGRFIKIGILFFAVFSFIVISQTASASQDVKDKQAILEKASKIQIPFIENQGQIQNESVRFYAQTFWGTVFITGRGEIVYALPERASDDRMKREPSKHGKTLQKPETNRKGIALREVFTGSTVKTVRGQEKAETQVSYFRGKDPSKWRSGIPSYNIVNVGEIYKGIELNLKAYGKNMEKLFTVKPEGKAEDIRVKVEGAKGIKVNEKGELEAETELGVIKFTKPIAYQEIRGKRVDVKVAYVIPQSAIDNPQLEYGFKVGEYDKTKELVIDPAFVTDPLLASTFLGGSSSDYAGSIAIDTFGNVYVAGETYSADFPVTPNAYDTTFNEGPYGGVYDAFVSKLDSSLSTLLASTFLGGDGNDDAHSIAIDTDGSVYVAGTTTSENFPVTRFFTYDNTFNGYSDAFITKLNSSLTALLHTTFLGGSDSDYAYSIAIDAGGNVYVAGETYSADFPATFSAYDTTFNGGENDAFVSKLDSSLSTLLASTFLGGGNSDDCSYYKSIAIDTDGNVYVAGYTYSTDFSVTLDAYDTIYNGGENDAFVSKLSSNLTALLASTFLGGSEDDRAFSIAIDTFGNVYVAGNTESTNFPVTPDAYDTTFNGAGFFFGDAFISKLNSSLTALLQIMPVP